MRKAKNIQSSSVKQSCENFSKSKVFFFFLGIISIILLSNLGSSAQCNVTGNIINSSSIHEGCTLNTQGTYTMTGGTFNVNTSSFVIRIFASNIDLNCNGTIINGNYSFAGGVFPYFVQISSNNATIRNCQIQKYRYGIRNFGLNNVKILNNTFNDTQTHIWLLNGTNISILDNRFLNNNGASENAILVDGELNDSEISRNIFYNSSGIADNAIPVKFQRSFNVTIANNTFYNYTVDKAFFTLNNTFSLTYTGNVGDCANKKSSLAFWLMSGNNNIISNNSHRYCDVAIQIASSNPLQGYNHSLGTYYSSNIIIFNNTLENSDRAILLGLVNNSNIYNNNILNISFSYDDYDVGIDVKFSNNISIYNNFFNESTSTSVWLQKVTNANVSNNIINMVSMSNRNKYLASDLREFSCTFKTNIIYKSFLTDNQENISSLFGVPNSANITFMNLFNSSNIIFLNNNISSNTQCYLFNEGGTNISHDFTNYRYVSYQAPTILLPRTEIFIPNGIINLTRFSYINSVGSNMTNYENGLTDKLYIRYFGQDYLNYSIYDDYLFFKAKSFSSSQQLNFYNRTKTLIYNSTGGVGCSTIAQCNDNVNISLATNSYTYVLDNFNLTEGVARQFSPLSISGSSTSKTITSQLSQAINATVVVNVPQCSLNAEYNGQNVDPISCSNNIATFNLNEIPSGSSQLLLNYNPSSYDCNGSTSTLSSGITSLIPLATILMVMMIFASIGLFTFGNGIATEIKSTVYILTAGTAVTLAIILAVGSIIVGSLPC